MPAPRKITEAQRQRIAEVLIARRAIVSDKELAAQFGVSIWAIRWNMTQILQSLAVSRGTIAVNIQQDGCSRPDSI